MPSTSSRSLVEPKPKKAKLQGYMPLSFTPLETWIHDICVLGRCDEGYTPNRERNDVLENAGLGKMKLVFPDKKAKHANVQSFLIEKFPRLRNGGGIEVLRAHGGGGGCRPLHLVPPGKDGYSLPYTKERFPQATVYIRPLQTDLDESPMSYQVHKSTDFLSHYICKTCHSARHMAIRFEQYTQSSTVIQINIVIGRRIYCTLDRTYYGTCHEDPRELKLHAWIQYNSIFICMCFNLGSRWWPSKY